MAESESGGLQQARHVKQGDPRGGSETIFDALGQDLTEEIPKVSGLQKRIAAALAKQEPIKEKRITERKVRRVAKTRMRTCCGVTQQETYYEEEVYYE